jgi:hypothetical protein
MFLSSKTPKPSRVYAPCTRHRRASGACIISHLAKVSLKQQIRAIRAIKQDSAAPKIGKDAALARIWLLTIL